jgi:hypothetical protein
MRTNQNKYFIILLSVNLHKPHENQSYFIILLSVNLRKPRENQLK